MIQNEDLWKAQPWKQLMNWQVKPNQEEMKTCLTNTLPGILLDLEMQYPSTVSLSHLQDYLSNQLYSLFHKENYSQWRNYHDIHQLLLYIQQYPNNHSLQFSQSSQSSIQKQMAVNLAILNLPSQPQLLETVIEMIVSEIAYIQRNTSMFEIRDRKVENEEKEKEKNILRYELETIRSILSQNTPYSISQDHSSLLLLELSKCLYNQGFHKLAIRQIR